MRLGFHGPARAHRRQPITGQLAFVTSDTSITYCSSATLEPAIIFHIEYGKRTERTWWMTLASCQRYRGDDKIVTYGRCSPSGSSNFKHWLEWRYSFEPTSHLRTHLPLRPQHVSPRGIGIHWPRKPLDTVCRNHSIGCVDLFILSRYMPCVDPSKLSGVWIRKKR